LAACLFATIPSHLTGNGQKSPRISGRHWATWAVLHRQESDQPEIFAKIEG
jgi:hypothetical protein